MSTRKESFSIDEFYHLYSRGVDKRPIFIDDFDRQRFIRLLYICNTHNPIVYRDFKNISLSEINIEKKLVAIGAYCLMPNHFHVAVREVEEGGIVKFMSKLLTSYSTYFNKKYERVGALMSGHFKSEHLDSDEYLKYIFAYIHLNPVKLFNKNWRQEIVSSEAVEDFLSRYKYSSYLDYVEGDREEGLILDKDAFPEYFVSQSFKEEMLSWLNFDPNYIGSPLAKTVDNSAL